VATAQTIKEQLRLPSPAPLPLGLAADGNTLWMASRETHRLYSIDIAKWTAKDEGEAPGGPFGLTLVGDEIYAVVGFGPKDHDRYIYRFIPGHGFKSDRIECPDLTGNFVAFDGDTLFLSQAHYTRIVALDGHGAILREISLAPRRPVGMTIADGHFYVITSDEEFENLELWKIDARTEKPDVTVLATVPFDARGLTYDGSRFWTSHRDSNEIVAFTV
jgi:hypothetical protein